MRKLTLFTATLLVLFSLATSRGFTQSSAPYGPFDQGTWILAFDMGPGAQVGGNGYGFGPGFKFSFENGTWQLGPGVLSLGGEIGLSFFQYHWDYTDARYTEKWFNYMFAARCTYHYGWDVRGLDTYAGIPVGIGFSSHKYDDYVGYKGYNAVYPVFGIFFGAAYYFNNSIGIRGEFGYNVTYANLGVIFKLK